MSKLILSTINQKETDGYLLQILDKNASVQDLLDELNEYLEQGKLARLWPADRSHCRGCHLCCHEPLPVTSIDVFNICEALKIEFLESFKYLNLEAEQNVVDITLKRKKGNCIFLDGEGLCKVYKNRPFLCQTYLCCHLSESTEALRSQIVNQGMDELIRLAITAFKSIGRPLPLSRGSCRRIHPNDWHVNCFSGIRSYRELKLEKVLSSALMKVLLV